MNIEIFAMRLTRNWTTAEQESALRILPPVRRDRLNKLICQQKQRDPIAAWILLFYALQKKYQWNTFPAISYTALGKPFFQNHPTIQFNLSHTDRAVLAVLGDSAVGIDIEKIRPVGERLKKRMGMGTTDEDFLRYWVRLEACGKRDGTGVLPHMDVTTLVHEGEEFQELNIFEGYVAGVAFKSGVQPPMVRIIEQEEISAFLLNHKWYAVEEG